MASASLTNAAPRPRIPWRWAGVPPAFRWLCVALACGAVLSLATPRISPSPWSPLELLGRSPPGGKAETGVPASMDLNRVGQVEVNDEVVIEIEATDAAGNPKLDLSGDQRFRGAYLDHYDEGRWRVGRPFTPALLTLRPTEAPQMDKDGEGSLSMQIMGKRPGGANPPGDTSRNHESLGPEYFDPDGLQRAARSPRLPGPRLPYLGPTQYFLKFTLKPRKAGGLFVADPVLLLPEHPYLPVAPENALIAPSPMFTEMNGSVVHISTPRGECAYFQVTRPVEDPDLGSPVEISKNYQLDLCAPPPESLRQWTDDLTRKLVGRPASVPRAEDVDFKADGARRMMLPIPREKVARALCNYLRSSGEYSYTLGLRREDRDLDPTEDFLRNVKKGHCERYAGALALMLCGVGVPARIVKGFRGCEARDDGTYAVRNSVAHTWVEALVARPDADGRAHSHWLALDPTPLQEALADALFSFSQWWESCRNFTADFWRIFVAEYGTEEQNALADALWNQLSPGATAIGQRRLTGAVAAVLIGVPLLLAATAGVYLWRRRCRMTAAPVRSQTIRFCARLLELLGRHRQLHPAAAQTPREFSATAAHVLREREATTRLADVPGQVVALFYRVRYGGAELAEAEREAIDRQLNELAAALAGG